MRENADGNAGDLKAEARKHTDTDHVGHSDSCRGDGRYLGEVLVIHESISPSPLSRRRSWQDARANATSNLRPVRGRTSCGCDQQRSSLACFSAVGPDLFLERFPADVRHRATCLASNKSLSSYVIPAPLASDASKREQAGTHAPCSLLSGRTIGATGSPTQRGEDETQELAWKRMGPASSRSGLPGPRGAGMTLVKMACGLPNNEDH